MKREDIENAAKNYDESLIYRCDIQKAFVEGAKWRINSVWHDASEQPNDGKLLITLKGKTPIVCGPNNTEWEDVVKEFQLERWGIH